MKTIATGVLLFILPCLVHAQLKKGKWLAGGIADFSHTSTDQGNDFYSNDSKATNYRIMPGAGYFFTDKLCGGLRVNISSQQTERDEISNNPLYSYIYSTDLTTSGVGLSPFLRYYLLPATQKLNVFIDGSYTYNKETRKTKIYQKSVISGGTPSEIQVNFKEKFKGSYYSVAAGPAIFIGQNASFELSLGYTFGKTKDTDQTTNRITFGTGFLFFFGK